MTDIINQIEGRVQVVFERYEGNSVFRDALWFTQAEYDLVTPQEIEIMQQVRYDNWLAIVNAIPTTE